MRSLYHRPRCLAAERLLKARLAAGYGSGRMASASNGWPDGTYAAAEAGARRITPDRAAAYAAAYGVPAAWLLGEPCPAGDTWIEGRARLLDDLDVAQVPHVFVSAGVAPAALHGAGRRLGQARVDAGFPSVRAAARHLGLPSSTCHAHESGQNGFGTSAAEMYGIAYGADPIFLMTGMPPGPDRGDARPTGRGPGDPVAVAAAVAAFRASQPTAAPGAPRLSRDALRSLTGSPRGDDRGPFLVLDVIDAPPGGRAQAGDRAVVDAGDREGRGLVARPISGRDGIAIVEVGPDGSDAPPDALGRVVAVIAVAG